MTRRLVILSRYTRMGASSRVRTMLYAPYLSAAGLEPETRSLFDDAYLVSVYHGTRKGASVLQSLARRVVDMRRAGQADAIWIEKEALPWLPWAIERAFLPRNVPFAVDFDDAVFHWYDLHRRVAVRHLLGRKLDHLMEASALVTAGNSYLADRAVAAGARRVEIVPTVVDIAAYRMSGRETDAAQPRIGWIGSPSTWAEYMQPMMPLLADVAAARDARILVVGAGPAAQRMDRLDSLPWREDTEVARIQDMSVGIMPLHDTAWARGKCGYKLLQYLACGVPVVASPVGVNREIVEHGVNGFLANTAAEWRFALETLLDDPDLRQRMGAAGRKKVEEHYSLQVWGPRLAQMLASIADMRAR